MISYSPTTGGFYHDALHAGVIPSDAVEISDARHRRLLALQAAGATISARDDGKPQARRASSSLTVQRAVAVAAIKGEAARRILLVAPLWRQINDVVDAQLMTTEQFVERNARHTAIRSIRSASNLIEVLIASATAAELRALDVARDPGWPPED